MVDVKASLHELSDLLSELEALLKNPDVGSALAGKGVNVSLALVAADGVRAYLEGDKSRAVEELETVVEEIKARREASRELSRGKPS